MLTTTRCQPHHPEKPDKFSYVNGETASAPEIDTLLEWMRNQAHRRLVGCPAHLALHTTALVNEAFIKLLKSSGITQETSRAYIYAATCRAVRECFADVVRKENAQCRGGGWSRVNLIPEDSASSRQADLLDLHDAIEVLAKQYPRAAIVVDLKFFGGFTNSEVAKHLSVSKSTVDQDWETARGFLFKLLTN
ncbi:MAG: hypothetical protein KDA91_20920 [Planctomycetaceae bacterium]|nr:hypothetical protein [Planctomycetaceae bacterium]